MVTAMIKWLLDRTMAMNVYLGFHLYKWLLILATVFFHLYLYITIQIKDSAKDIIQVNILCFVFPGYQ